jgi:putative protein-disulfide isomerase
MKLYYFFDPFCGWCYGFSDVINRVVQHYPDLELNVVCGGMVTGKAEGYLGEKGKYILHVLPRLIDLSGCEFGDDYIKKLETGDLFCSSITPSLALIIIKNNAPEKTLETIHFLQRKMFYEGHDLQHESIYSELTEVLELPFSGLWEQMQDNKWREVLDKDFELTADIGIQGFPTLVADIQEKLYLVTHGWASFSAVEKVMDELLEMENV